MKHSPLQLRSTDVVDGVVIHIIQTKDDVATIHLPEGLGKVIADKVSIEELLFTIHHANGSIIVAKSKDEKEVGYRHQALRALGAKLQSAVNGMGAVEATLLDSGHHSTAEVIDICEGMALSSYQFLRYKTGEKAKPRTLVTLNVGILSIDQAELDELMNVVSATCLVRDLVNDTPSNLTPEILGRHASEVGSESGFSVKVMGRKEIDELGMGGLLAVNKGSVAEPAFIVMEYRPEDAINSRPIVLVGKGVTYDTGGYSIKTSGMAGMKADMAGGAAVIGTMTAVASNQLSLHVVGLVPATDNRIDGKAIVPDDVITMMSGATVEVQNTDAEGRLILADALHFAKRYEPELVIDLATLTGAAARITAHYGSAMCADKAPQKERLMESGEQVYERLMEFPMWREFHEAIRSDVADIKNIGGAAGGNITAATFLHHFTDYPWIHLEIAGPSMMEAESDYRPKGASGVGVRLLYHYLKSFSAD
jgi:leucyl aminopeptidase